MRSSRSTSALPATTETTDWWHVAQERAAVAARRIPPVEWHMEAKLDRPDMTNIYPSAPRFAQQHFIELGMYDQCREAEPTVYLGADGKLYTWAKSPAHFMPLPERSGRRKLARIAADLERFYKLSDEHDALYLAITTELTRIADWRVFARTGFRRYATVFTSLHRVGDGCRRRFVPGGEAEYFDDLRVSAVPGLEYLIDEKGRLVAFSNHRKRLTVVEPCEIFALSDLRRIHGRLETIR